MPHAACLGVAGPSGSAQLRPLVNRNTRSLTNRRLLFGAGCRMAYHGLTPCISALLEEVSQAAPGSRLAFRACLNQWDPEAAHAVLSVPGHEMSVTLDNTCVYDSKLRIKDWRFWTCEVQVCCLCSSLLPGGWAFTPRNFPGHWSSSLPVCFCVWRAYVRRLCEFCENAAFIFDKAGLQLACGSCSTSRCFE